MFRMYSVTVAVKTLGDKGEYQSALALIATTMPNIKLTYFNGKGRGETARLILAYGGMHYEDRRVSFGKYRLGK